MRDYRKVVQKKDEKRSGARDYRTSLVTLEKKEKEKPKEDTKPKKKSVQPKYLQAQPGIGSAAAIRNFEETAPPPIKPPSKGLASAMAGGLGNIADHLSFGLTKPLTSKFEDFVNDTTKVQPGQVNPDKQQAADLATGLIGDLGAGAGAYRLGKSIATPFIKGLPGLADKAIAPIASRLSPTAGALARVGAQQAGRVGGVAATGALSGALFQAPTESVEELHNPNAQTLSQHLGDVGNMAALGAVADPLAEGILGGLGRLLERKKAVTPEVEEATVRALDSVQPSRMGVAYGTLRPASNEQYINRVMGDIKSTVHEQMTPPLENPNELAKWLKPHLGDSSLNEIRKLSYEDLRQLAGEVQRNLSTYDLAKAAAKKRGYDLDQLLNNQTPSIKQEAERLRMGRVAGAIEPPTQNVRIATPRTGEAIPEAAPIVPRTEPDIMPASRAPEQKASAADDALVVKEPRIRDRVYNKLDEAEKAARARIAARKGRLSANPVGEWGDHAIIMAAQTGKGVIKAADFTEALVREFGESIRPHSAAILRQTKEILRREERIASKEGQDAAVFNAGGGDANSFEAKITRGKRKDKRSFVDKWETSKTQFVEDIAPLSRVERNITGKIASAEKSFYKSARLFKGVPEKVTKYIDTRLTPIVRGVEKAGYTSDDLGRYALAVHAKDVNAAGYKSGFTNAEIDDVIQKIGTPGMESARKQLVGINNEMLDGLVDSNVISADLRDVLRERWKNYIPLNRDVDDVVGNMSGLSDALANVANPIKKLKGSERSVIEPLENMVQNISKSITSAERNKVATQLAELAKKDTDELFIRKMGPDERLEGKMYVTVREGGDPVHYEVDKDVYNAILSLDRESSTALIRFLSAPASWLRAGATLTPEFIVRNPIRDYRNARIISESGFGLGDWAVGAASSIMGKFGKGKLYRDWVENLGAYGNMVTEDRNSFAAAQRKVLTQTKSQKVWNVVTPKNLITLMRTLSDITESATKVGEYRAALRSGATKQEAAYRSRDLMDFARAGTSIRQANKIIAFVNAGIQGKSRTIRAFKDHPVRTSVRIFQHMVIPTVGIYYSNKYFANDTQKETIKNAPAWQKNTFWLFAIPGTDTVARIPKPFDFAAVANVVDRSMEFFDQNDKEAFEGFGQGLLADNALPVMITGIQPLLEGGANYSFFRQGPIIPQRDAGLEFKDQYDPTKTSETAKAIASGVDATLGKMGGNFRSPYVIDNTIQGLLAGGGKYVTDGLDNLLRSTGAVDRPVAPAKPLEQKSIIRSFTVDPRQGGKAMDEIYNKKDDLSREKASANRNDSKLPKDKATQLKKLTKTTDLMSAINKQIRTIESSKLLSSKEKRSQIDVLIAKRNKLAVDAMVK